MGRAVIVTDLHNGKFDVDVEYNMADIDRERERINEAIDKLTDERSALEDKLTDAHSKSQDEKEKMNGLIDRLTNKVRQSLLDTLGTIESQCATIESDESTASLAVGTGGSAVASSSGALPPSPPSSITDAYALVNSSIVAAQAQLSDAVARTNDQGTYASDTTSALGEDPANFADANDIITNAVTDSYPHTGSYVDAGNRIDDILSACTALSALLTGPTYSTAKGFLDTAVSDFHDAKADVSSLASRAGTLTGLWNKLAAVITPQDALEIQKGITTEQRAYMAALLELRGTQRQIDDLDAKREQLLSRLEFLNGFAPSVRWTVWSADLGPVLEGDKLGVIEVPGEFNPNDPVGELIVRPTYDPTKKVWTPERDSVYTYAEAVHAAGFFYNLAMLPGWQVFKPQYRFARITEMNDDGTVKVVLISPLLSSQQQIDVTPKGFVSDDFTGPPAPEDSVYEKVPVSYMDCNAAAFLVGDEVVIEYTDRDARLPVVVGFRKNPRGCGGISFINPNGTFQVTSGAGTSTGTWRFATASREYGQVSWFSGLNVLTWVGPRERYINPIATTDLKAEIYQSGRVIDAPGLVLGACLNGSGSAKVMRCVTADTDDSGQVTQDIAWEAPYVSEGTLSWVQKYTMPYTDDGSPGHENEPKLTSNPMHWFFNASGTQGQSCKDANNGADTWRRVQLDWDSGFSLQEANETHTVVDVRSDASGDTRSCPPIIGDPEIICQPCQTTDIIPTCLKGNAPLNGASCAVPGPILTIVTSEGTCCYNSDEWHDAQVATFTFSSQDITQSDYAIAADYHGDDLVVLSRDYHYYGGGSSFYDAGQVAVHNSSVETLRLYIPSGIGEGQSLMVLDNASDDYATGDGIEPDTCVFETINFQETNEIDTITREIEYLDLRSGKLVAVYRVATRQINVGVSDDNTEYPAWMRNGVETQLMTTRPVPDEPPSDEVATAQMDDKTDLVVDWPYFETAFMLPTANLLSLTGALGPIGVTQ